MYVILLTTDTVGLEGYRLTVNRTLPIIPDQNDEDEDCKLHPPMIYDDIDQVHVYMHLLMQCTTSSSILSYNAYLQEALLHLCWPLQYKRTMTP